MKRLALILSLAVLACTPAHAFKLKDLFNQPSNGQSQSQTQPPGRNHQKSARLSGPDQDPVRQDLHPG